MTKHIEEARELINGAVKEICRTNDLIEPSGYKWEEHRDFAAYTITDLVPYLYGDETEKPATDEIYAVAASCLFEWNAILDESKRGSL